ncbi:MAG: GIY-YIG nuclease family protein [Patescibacteria group bacterium]|nr:GIY-YIG nuclease family protein [Patescibacteria group bacterium]MCL5095397.1 GIY-YIG nuclease family protein [Patescibacteria group bacterium]
MKWYVYIVECSDGSLYTGITTDIKRRIIEHNNDNIKGAKSLRPKRPVTLKYFEEYNNQSEARKRESAIKKWARDYKIKLILNKKKGLP